MKNADTPIYFMFGFVLTFINDEGPNADRQLFFFSSKRAYQYFLLKKDIREYFNLLVI